MFFNVFSDDIKCAIIEAGGTKFAECFVCNQRGHLSKNCPQNTHGIYPKVLLFPLVPYPVKYIIILV